jgi:hypothetical protein
MEQYVCIRIWNCCQQLQQYKVCGLEAEVFVSLLSYVRQVISNCVFCWLFMQSNICLVLYWYK